jgi:hypothetical protein
MLKVLQYLSILLFFNSCFIFPGCTTIRYAEVEWIPENIKWHQSFQEADSMSYSIFYAPLDTPNVNITQEDTNRYYWASDTVLWFWSDGMFIKSKEVLQLKLCDSTVSIYISSFDSLGCLYTGKWDLSGNSVKIAYQRKCHKAVDSPLKILISGTEKIEKITIVKNKNIVTKMLYGDRVYIPVKRKKYSLN